MHALGFEHMQSHPDRDHYVKVLNENIEPNMTEDYEKLPREQYGDFGTGYDFKSIMHYELDDDKLLPKDPNQEDGYQIKKKLSKGDIKRINLMYDCAPSYDSSESHQDESSEEEEEEEETADNSGSYEDESSNDESAEASESHEDESSIGESAEEV